MENWKDITGYEGLYQVSDLGNIKALNKNVKSRYPGVLRNYKEKLLTIKNASHGYKTITLMQNGKKRTFRIHRLVAIAFLPNPSNLSDVNHKYGNKADNRVSQLEWSNHSANIQHAHSTGLLKSPKGYEHHASKKLIDSVTGTTYRSISEAAKHLNINHGTLLYRLNKNNGLTALKFI